MFGKRKPQEMSVEELEKMLLMKRRQSRLERFQRLSKEGRSSNEALVGTDFAQRPAADKPPAKQEQPQKIEPPRKKVDLKK